MIISETPVTENPNPNPKSKTTNAYHIGGIQVDFPYRPYGTQLAFMGRVISTLDRRCHALLESPTGTGKSLSLLCSTLAWQRNFAAKMSQSAKPDPRSMTEPLDHGGGFVPEDDDDDIADYDDDGPSSLRATGIQTKRTVAPEANATDKKSNKKKKKPPTIYYASRTHSQISQVIREYRKTSYRVPMAVLGSKKHYCTNPKVRGNPNMEEQCKQLLSKKNPLCPEFKNYSGVKCHPSLQKGGLHEVHDIEDLVKVGEAVQGCSYYAARSMARDANLVFCPYNYVVNPVIRGAMEVDIRGAIVVLDEAHNMEDMARDAGSVDIDEETLLQLDKELEVLCEVDDMYPPLYEMTQGLLSWIDRRKKMLVKRDFQLYVSCWTGDKALRELEEANIFQNSFQALLGCATSAIRVATDLEEENAQHITGAAVQILEGLFSSLTYFFSRDGSHMSDYQLALRKHVKKDAGRDSDEWTNTISLWCLNPAVVFKDIAELSLSVILTSGTLSPMDSFSSELGVQFGTSLEAQHVIDINSQVWPAIISTGRSNLPLNASYRTAHEYDFQDSLGKSLEDIFRTVPGGCLVFFPSYKLMEKLSKRWCETGQWSQLNATKALFVEPRGCNQDDFETVLRGYYDAVRGVNKPLSGRRKRIKKVENFSNQFVDNTNATGAALLAVCRGKVSEGIDFSDDNARVVIIVGIPFPNVNDIQVDLKKKYNDTYKSSKNLLSGSEWYCYQAFRALNQAAGRCIRHSSDYGAIIFLDERYREKRNRAYVSKWLRNSIRQYDSFDLSLQELKSFFSNVKERVSKNTVNASDISGCNEESSPCPDQSKGCTRKQDKELNKSGHCSQKQLSLTQCNASFSSFKSQPNVELQKMDDDADKTQEVVELYSSQEDSGYPETLPNPLSLDDPEEAFVMETPFAGCSATIVSSLSCSKGEAATNVSNRLSYDPLLPVASCSKVSPKSQCLDEFTPQKNPSVRTSSKTIRIEPHLNLSVNSCSQKRRKSISPSAFCLIEEQHDHVENNASDCTNFISNSLAYGDTTRRIDFALDYKLSEETSRSMVSPLGITNSAASSSGLAMNKRLHIRCSFCENFLGLPDNQHFVECYSNSSSKAHLESLHRKISRQSMRTSEGIPVLIVDIASVHQQLFSITLDGDSELCKWCEKDGCVFKTIFCPFCPTLDRCLLGVQVMATDASNTHLLNKIIFFADQLEIKTSEACSPKPIKDKDTFPVSTSSKDEANSFERFLYNTQDSSRGWITTKSKLKLPKRGSISKVEDRR